MVDDVFILKRIYASLNYKTKIEMFMLLSCVLVPILAIGSNVAFDFKSSYTRYVARVMYDGTRFKGWQDQGENLRTVQGTLTQTLSQRFNAKVTVTGAGRTDLGVHSRGQAVHFDIEHMIENLEKLQFSLNQMLPDDVKLYNLSLAPPGNSEQETDGEPWHATKSATGKLYSYTFTTNQYVDPMQRLYCAHVTRQVDVSLFVKCLSLFEGTHDFAAFANGVPRTTRDYLAKNLTLSTIRTIHSARLKEFGNGYYRVDVHLNSALYRMVRNIVWACVTVASSELDIDDLQTLIVTAPPRTANKVYSAPPQGLCLEHAFYDHY